MVIAWIVAATLVATFVVQTAFLAAANVARVLKQGVWVPPSAKVVAFCWLVVGYFADVAYNLTWGTIHFRELPRELLFTSRVKRHVRGSAGWRYDKAARWRDFLNAVDEGHIRSIE
jgi:hypothetical protein